MADELTQETKYAYIARLTQCGLKRQAAQEVGTNFAVVAIARKQDPAFDAGANHAYELYKESLEAEIHRRAVLGWEEPVYQGGREVGKVRKFDSALLSMHARRHIPEYREQLKVEVDQTTRVLVVPGMLGATEAQWEEVHRGQLRGGNGNGNGTG